MENRAVLSVITNWYVLDQPEDGVHFDEYNEHEDDVTVIEYHKPMGEGDKHYVDIYMANGEVWREFNINTIKFSEEVK